jgi:hypothetical protein
MSGAFIKTFVFTIILFRTALAQSDTSTRAWGDWQTWCNQGNETYTNPILPSDYSDLDCIRV